MPHSISFETKEEKFESIGELLIELFDKLYKPYKENDKKFRDPRNSLPYDISMKLIKIRDLIGEF